ncbi:MAG TPA: transaldolase [Hyphomicrobiaceae bacterium]|nr:transaldolase [Hyphomicrobiaceae bacterium]
MLDRLKVKIYADGADLKSMTALAANPHVKGFTTNPSLMRKAGVADYSAFARDVLKVIPDRPVSFEVFADEPAEMEAQGREIATWGRNVYVKIPVMNTKGVSTAPIISRLSKHGVALNVTAIFTVKQVIEVTAALDFATPAVISVFAGRIADTGVDPMPMMRECVQRMKAKPKAELLWASPREMLNIWHADECGCHIITVQPDVLSKLNLIGKDLDAYSLETVKTFYQDATAAGYKIATRA